MEYKATEGDFEESQGSGNYTSASFALIQRDNASLYPQSDLEMEFDRKGIGGNSIRQSKDKKLFDIRRRLTKYFVYYITRMYDVHGDIGVEELTTSGFVVWQGIHLILHKWR